MEKRKVEKDLTQSRLAANQAITQSRLAMTWGYSVETSTNKYFYNDAEAKSSRGNSNWASVDVVSDGQTQLEPDP